MPVTYERLVKETGLRNKFMNLDSEKRSMVYNGMQAPEGFTPEHTKILQHKIENMSMPWKDVPFEAIKHIKPNAMEMGRNMWNMVKHPVKSVEAIEKLAVGGMQKLIPGEQKLEKSFDATTRYFIDRYKGNESDSLAGLKRTIATKPLDFFNDLSTVATGVGALAKAAAVSKIAKGVGLSDIPHATKLSLVRQGVEHTGNKIMEIGRYADPVAGPIKASVKLSNKLVPGFMKSTVQKAVKFEKTKRYDESINLDHTDALTSEFIDRKLWVTRGSRAKLGKEITEASRFVKSHLAKASMKGEKINRFEMIDDLDRLKVQINKTPVSLDTMAKELDFVDNFKESILTGKRNVNKSVLNDVNKSTHMAKTAISKNVLLAQIDATAKTIQGQINTLAKSGKPYGALTKRGKVMEGLRHDVARTKGQKVAPKHEMITREQLYDIRENILNHEAVLTPTEANYLKKLLNKSFVPKIQTSVDAAMKVTRDRIRSSVMGTIARKYPVIDQVNSNTKVMIQLQQAISKRIRELSTSESHMGQNMMIGGGASIVSSVAFGADPGRAAMVGGIVIPSVIVGRYVLNDPQIKLLVAKAVHWGEIQSERSRYITNATNAMYQGGRAVTEQGRNEEEEDRLDGTEGTNEINTIRSNVMSMSKKMSQDPENAINMQNKAQQVIDIMDKKDSLLIIQSLIKVIDSDIPAKSKLSQIDRFMAGNIGRINPAEIDAFNVFAATAMKKQGEQMERLRIKKNAYIDKIGNARMHSDYRTYMGLMEESKGTKGLNITDSDIKRFIDKKQETLRSQGMSDDVRDQLQSNGGLPISFN